MQIGIVAMGSHEEKHGCALPQDTDARIARYIAKKVAERTDVKFLGTLNSSHEYLDIDHGNHQTIPEVLEEIERMVTNSNDLGFEAILIINAHGGNIEVEEHLSEIEKRTGVKIELDSTIIELEGAHAGTEEASIGALIGITDEEKLQEHTNTEKYPEVGFAGYDHLKEKYDWAKEHAKEIQKNGVKVDKELGKELVEKAVKSGEERIKQMKKQN